MAVRHFKATGTLATNTDSTPDDWTDANCHPISSLMTRGFSWSGMATGDQIIIDNGTHACPDIQTALFTGTSGVQPWITSRSGDPTQTTLTFSSATVTSIRGNNGSKVVPLKISGVTITNSAPHTVAGPVLMQVTGMDGSHITAENCRFIDSVNSYNNSGLNGFFSVSDGITATVTFTNCTIDNLTSTHTGGRYFAYIGTLATMIFDGCAISNITHNTTGTSNHTTGGVYGPGQLQVNNCTLSDCTCTSATHGEYANDSFFHPLGQSSFTGLHASGITLIGAQGGAVVAKVEGPYTFEDCSATNCASYPGFINGVDGDHTNAVGGTFLPYGPLAQGTANKIRVRNCLADEGTGWYCSQGAGVVLTDLIVENCIAWLEGVLYFGGWGDVTVDGFRIVGCESGVATYSFEGWSGAIHAHNHFNSTRSCTRVIRNGVIEGFNQRQDGYAAVRIRGLMPEYSHTVIVENLVIDSPGHSTQMGFHETEGCPLHVTVSNVAMNGGESSIEITGTAGTKSIAQVVELTTANRPTRWGVSQGNAARRAA